MKRRRLRNVGSFLVGAFLLVAAWGLTRPRKAITNRNIRQIPTTLAFSPDGTLLASGGWARTLNILDGNTLRSKATVAGFKNVVQPLAFSPDSRTIAAGESHDSIYLIDALSGARLQKLKGHKDELASVSFSPDGKYLATTGLDKVAILWNIRTGRLVHKFWGQKNGMGPVLFTPEGKTLVTSDYESIRQWDVETGKLRRKIPSSMGYPRSFSADGNYCAGSYGSTTGVWETSNWNVIHTFPESGRYGMGVSNNYQLVVATKSNVIVRDLLSGKMLKTIRVTERASTWPPLLLRMFPKLRPGPLSPIACVAISKDGSKIAIGLQDGSIQMDVNKGY